MTRLMALNFFVLQWFWIRLARTGIESTYTFTYRQDGWAIIGPVAPLTGWNEIPYIGRAKPIVSWKIV